MTLSKIKYFKPNQQTLLNWFKDYDILIELICAFYNDVWYTVNKYKEKYDNTQCH